MISQWTAREAWKCLGIIFILELVVVLFLILLKFYWSVPQIGFFSRYFEIFTFLIPVLYFARIKSFSEFKLTFHLDQKPSEEIWMAIIIITASQGVTTFAAYYGLPNHGPDMPNLKAATMPELLFYGAPILLAPFWEEIVMRGFLYRAFRSSYSAVASSTLIIALTAVTHGSQFFSSIVSAIVLSGFALILCWLIERTGRIWNCIITHFVFNAIFLVSNFASS